MTPMEKEHLIESIKILNSNWILLFLLAFVKTLIVYDKLSLFGILGLLILLFMIPALYGRLQEHVLGGKRSSLYETFRLNAFHYYAVMFTLLVPIHIITNVLGLTNMMRQNMNDILTFVSAFLLLIVDILLIYILPLVFINKDGLSSIPTGLRLLSNNLMKSIPLLLLCFVKAFIKWLPGVFIINKLQSDKIFSTAYNFAFNILSLYVGFLIFLLASIYLVKEKKHWQGNETIGYK